MSANYEQIQETIEFIRRRTDFEPRYGIVLGTGLSGLADDIEVVKEMSYAVLPYFPVSTVASHRGKLIFGRIAGVPVVAMAGRFHYYEGYTMQQVTFPIRVMKALGVERLLISNAAGSVNGDIEAGDVVFIRDHINLQPENPLHGPNDERLGPRFPDMLKTYDRATNARALTLAERHGARAHEGVYVALPGPNLETPAEYHFLHVIGADVVGMSTVPEVLVARHMALPVFVISVVSNKCYPLDEIKETTMESVIAVVEGTAPKVQLIVKDLLTEWNAG
jgi:purine-nucleoside phosphorylase